MLFRRSFRRLLAARPDGWTSSRLGALGILVVGKQAMDDRTYIGFADERLQRGTVGVDHALFMRFGSSRAAVAAANRVSPQCERRESNPHGSYPTGTEPRRR